ncbi:MAG: 4-alpha-glucanotransferase [Actinobacteria bacterium]|nr:4-alpha-glucanotransferase [Actinomycetota bacterium]
MPSADEQAAAWGIQVDYESATGEPVRPPERTLDHVLGVLAGAGGDERPEERRCFVTIRPGHCDLPDGVPEGVDLHLEDGTDLGPVDSLPPDLPVGYHELVGFDGVGTTLAVAPAVAHLPDDLRTWGWAVQLYAARSRSSWGHGDLADAAALGGWSAGHGGRPTLQLNPLHASNPSPAPRDSPYFASSRCFRSPLYLRVEDVPGASDHDAVAGLAQRGRALSSERVIDRSQVLAAKREALALLFDQPRGGARDRAEQALAADPVLAAWAAFCAAVEVHGGSWSAWPAELRRPDGPGWPALRRREAARIALHAWLQYLVADQLGALAGTVPLIHDVAIGTDPDGFDAWYWQDAHVLDGTRIGAPPDQFNTQGQDWGLPPLHPWALREARYEPVIRALRAAAEHGAGLRMDHVMGLFRLFWIPPGEGAAAGAYVRYPSSDLLDVLVIESVRAGAFVVGEDLGTVEPGVREEMAARRMLGYRVLLLEEEPASALPELALSAATTHDLPTVPGFWTGADLAAQERLGLHPNVEDTVASRERLARHIEASDDTPIAEVVERTYRLLGASPSRVAVGQLDDPAGVEERPNMPGTTDEWPNWRLALPRPLEDLLADPSVVAAAAALSSGRTG